MPPVLHLILLVLAFGCFVLSLLPPAAPNWNRLISLGLTFATAAFIPWPL